MTDYILERASIGSVIVSSLGAEDPERNPEYDNLDDDQFQKIVIQFNSKRDVYGIISILSLSWNRKKIPWLNTIYNYVLKKVEKYLEPVLKKEEFK